tara:strand:- start:2270 stop:4336 length:2067 start_codon:yes stop_codon:yes gene_type:complete
MDADNNSETIHLLVISSQFALVNKLLSSLRKDGLQLKASGVDNNKLLQEQLKSGSWDLLIYCENTKLSLGSVFDVIQHSGMELPLIVLTQGQNLKALDIYKSRIRDCIPLNDEQRILFTIKREVQIQRLEKKYRLLALDYRELLQRHQSLMDNANQALAYILDGMHLYCNQSYAELFSADSPASLQHTPLLDLFRDGEREALKNLLATPVDEEQKLELDFANISLELIFTPVSVDNQDCLQLIARPASANENYAQKLQSSRKHDLLTLLYNRSYFTEKIEQAISKAIKKNKNAVLILVRINEFLDIKSTIGLSNANQVLNDIANFLRASVKKKFAAARLSDYEFGLLMNDFTLTEAAEMASFIKSKINNHITSTALPSLQLSCSIGISMINSHALDAEDILARARLNLDRELKGAANKTGSIQPDTDITQLMAMLETALQKKSFTLLFQPMVSLQDEEWKIYEVLSRMLDDKNNIVLPGQFFPLANQNGMGEILDQAIITLAGKAIKKTGNIPVRLNLNLTSNTLVSKTFLPWVRDFLSEQKISSERLIFQLSEMHICNNLEYCVEFCEGLEQLGIDYIVCHYGCVIDPIKYLNAIHPKCVKLDTTLVKDLNFSQYHQDELRNVINELHDQEFKVIVPQVEDTTVLPLLWKLGVDYVQGYSLERPSQNMDYEFIQDHVITLQAPGHSS